MIKVLVFIVLKIAEIGGVIFIPYWLGYFPDKYLSNKTGVPEGNKFIKWLTGVLIVIIVAGLITIALPAMSKFVGANWELAGKITGG